MALLGHYLVVALAGFRRDPLSTAIKILALSLGLICLLAAHAVGDYIRRSDDNWRNASRIRIVAQYPASPEAQSQQGILPTAPAPAGRYLRTDIPELEAVARQLSSTVSAQIGNTQRSYTAIGVDADFVRIFDFAPKAGDVGSLPPRTVLVEETAASQLFGAVNPIGQVLTLGAGVDVTVGGVFRVVRRPSLLESVRLIVSMETADEIILEAFRQGNPNMPPVRFSEMENWNAASFLTYLLLPEDGSLSSNELERRLAEFARRRIPAAVGPVRYEVRELSGLNAAVIDRSMFGSQGLSLTTTLYLLGALVLMIACVNFSGLVTAMTDRRAGEIGLRRTLGATPRQIALQTLTETALLSAFALLLVLPLLALTLAPLRIAIGMDVRLPGIDRVDYWLSVAGIFASVVLLAGTYPALVLSRIRPILALRAGKKGGTLRSALTVVQFAVASFLIIVVGVMVAQKNMLRPIGISEGADPRVMISYVAGRDPVNMETLRTELLRHHSIVSVSYGTTPYGRHNSMASYAASEAAGAARIRAQVRGVAVDYFKTIGSRILAGREFSVEQDTPDGSPAVAVIDAGTAALLGYTPDAAIGKMIYSYRSAQVGSEDADSAATPVAVIGVVENRPLEYTATDVSNYVYVYSPSFALQPTPLIHISRADASGALAHIDATWRRLNPNVEMSRMFLDQVFDQSFRMFSMLNGAVTALAAAAIGISAMGLFGLASFVVQRRVKEIGIRKTLGASPLRVVMMMVWRFSRPVIVANVIAWPFAWLAATAYLRLFATRIEIPIWPFLSALAASLCVAWLAVAMHVARAALVKPAMVLKAG